MSMFISPQSILTILSHYKYWLIFPIAIFEGPIIIIITGFLFSLGVLNGYLAYGILVLADTIGDSMYYCIGKYWGRSAFVKKFGSFLGYDHDSEEFLENHFRKHKVKTFLVGKISHGLGSSVQIAGGIAGVSYFEFLLLSLLGTIPKTLALFVIGFYLGNSYIKIDGYLDHVALFTTTFAVLMLLYFGGRKYVKSFLAKNEDD